MNRSSISVGNDHDDALARTTFPRRGLLFHGMKYLGLRGMCVDATKKSFFEDLFSS